MFKGPGAAVAQNVKVDVSQVYSYDSKTGLYAEATSKTVPAATKSGTGTCTCTNSMREIEYTVKLKFDKTVDLVYRNRYVIDSISAVVVLEKNPITAQCTKKVGVM